MKSPFSEKEMELKFERRSINFRKEKFEITYHFYYESDYQEEITDKALEEINLTQVYNQYRAKYNLPFPDEIIAIREKYDVSTPKMSALLGFGVNMYRNYENGEVPSESNARLIQLAKNPQSFKTLISLNHDISEKDNQKLIKRIDHLIEEEKKHELENILKDYIFPEKHPTIYSGFRYPDLNKITEMIVFFTEKFRPDKTNLNHLLFYADFLEYKKSCYSISGSSYAKRTNIGPTLYNSNTLFEFICNNHDIDILTDCTDHGIYEQFIPTRPVNESIFKSSQLETLNEVVEKFRNIPTLRNIGECQIPDSSNDRNNTISYDIGFCLEN